MEVYNDQIIQDLQNVKRGHTFSFGEKEEK